METLNNFIFTDGTSIHKCDCHPNEGPHLTGTLDGNKVHIPYFGQTTLGMFDTGLSGHTFDEVNKLHQDFPETFNNSGLKW